MKKISCLFVAFMAAISVCFAQTVPNVKVENAKGMTISTSTLITGKPFIISFWSTSCKPCIMELNAINEQLVDWRKEVDFDVVAVSIDDVRSLSRARAMCQGFGWEFTCVFDKNQDFRRAMNVSMTPQTYVVDGKGKIVYSHTGYTPGSESVLLKQLKAIGK